MSSMNVLAHLKIPLIDIKVATNDFNDENFIGVGGFGKVYKGQLSRSEGPITVAVKRLATNSTIGQGQREFLIEITMLSRYQHKNLVTLLGFCDEDNEKILVYEHEFNGSLDKHLSSIHLTWSQRLKICCGAAHGLSYLHNPDEGLQRVLHRDIKSSNILLDQIGEAKISDFGLSKLGPANQQFTFLVTAVAGTIGYVDPLYIDEGILTKESDVYSFGVVLFEVLCGRLCFENYDDGRRFLTHIATQRYEQNKLDDIIYDNIKEQMDPDNLAKFSAVAYKCLREDRDKRPTMAEVVKELEAALDFQKRRDANVAHMEGCSTSLLDLQSTLSTFKQYRLRVIAQLGDENKDKTLGIDFDRDDELFCIAGRGGNTGFIKIFNFSKTVSESLVEYHPVVDIQTSSTLPCLSWNKDKRNHIATGDCEGRVTIWDWNNKQDVMEYKEHEGWVFTLDSSYTEPSLLVSGGSHDHKVKVWSSNQKTSVTTINIGPCVSSVKYHPESSMHIAVGSCVGCLYYDLRNTSSPLNSCCPGYMLTGHTDTGHTDIVTYAKFLSDNELVFASTDDTLRLWDIKQNMLVGTYKGHINQKYHVGLSVNSDFMACGSETNDVFVYHKAFSKPLTSRALGSPFWNDNFGNERPNGIGAVCWKSDGSAIVASSFSGVVQVLAFEVERG